MAAGKPKRDERSAVRPEPISLAPLSFEDAVRALAATPPMKPKRQPATRRKPKRKKTS